MKEISIFLANNYVWFIIIDVLLLFALIGFLIDNKKKEKVSSETEVLDTIKFEENPKDTIEELTTQLGDKANKSLNSVVSSVETLETNKEETETLM